MRNMLLLFLLVMNWNIFRPNFLVCSILTEFVLTLMINDADLL